tara:strand:+ start:5433 stop:5948 length:516 start_codon:yes stop_codon:yes gene_type:complete
MYDSGRVYRGYRIEYDEDIQEDCIKNMYFIYPPDEPEKSHFADVSPYGAIQLILDKYIDFHISEGFFPDRKSLRKLGIDQIGPTTEKDIKQAKLKLALSQDYNTNVEQADLAIDEVNKFGLICIRCGGRGGTIVEAEGGYLPCFACGDSGTQTYEDWLRDLQDLPCSIETV